MRAFVLNTQQMNVAKEKLRNLEQLIPEVSLKKEDAKILEKIKFFVKKLAETKDVVLMAMGIRPDSPIVWWIIFGIILFLAVVSTAFYLVMLKQLQKNKFAPKKVTPAAPSNTPPVQPPEAAPPEEKKK